MPSARTLLTRRRFAALSGAALLGALAGCTPSDDAGSSLAKTGSAGSADVGSAAQTDAAEAVDEGLSALHVEGTRLVDDAGEAVVLRGVSTHGLAWYPEFVNEECFAQLHDEWGAGIVRLALYTADSGGWCTDGDRDELREVVDRGVQAAVACGMYVVIDWHILSDGDPNTYLDEACDFFDEMSARYAGQPAVIYEICNEPNGSATWEDVSSYAEEVLPHIRENAPDAVVLVGTPNWSQYVEQAAAAPLSDDNVLYTLHFYAATHTDSLRSSLRSAVEGGLPVFVSEFGICDASGAGSIDEDSADAWVELCDELGVSMVAWNLSNKDETSAILDAGCTKTAGFDEEDLSASGLWVRDMLVAHADFELADGGAADEDDEDEEDAAADDDGGTTSATAGLTCDYYQDGSWESGGMSYALFRLSVENGTGAAISGWRVTVTFADDVELSDGWNGTFSCSGSTLTIDNASYNGDVAAGDAAGDVGFIVYAASAPAIAGVSCRTA